MNRYILIRRLRGPAILLLVGLIALLHSTGVVHSFWRWFWPLLFITLGLLMLAERAALAADGGYPGWPNGGGPTPGAGMPPYQGQPYQGQPYQGQPYGGQTSQGQPTAIVRAGTHDFEKDPNGGQS